MKKFKRKVLAMLMTNNFGSSLRQQLFDSAPFCSELLYTAIPQRAATGTTATFTRATTKTIENNDGYLVTLLAGEIGFPGARRVRNLVANKSEDNTVGSSLNSNATTTQTTVSLNTINNSFWYKDGVTLTVGNTYVGSLEISTAVPATVTVLIGGTAGGNTALSVAATTTPTRVEVAFTATIAGTVVLGINNTGGVNTQTGTYTITDIQIEDVTGRADQTTPSEYVSVGVPTDWLGDELVTNGTFDTDTTGWTAGTGNSLAWQTGAAKCTRAVAGDRAFFGQGFSVVVGAKYVISAEVLSDGTSTTARAYLGTTIGTGDIVTGPAAAFGQVVFEYTAGATGTIYIWFYGTSTAAGNYIVIDNISVKPAYYHGSMVDGVKCFPTDLSGNPIPSTTLLGYQAQGARTNYQPNSNAFTTTWSKTAGVTLTQNAVDDDGATTAWTAAITGAGQSITYGTTGVAANTICTLSMNMWPVDAGTTRLAVYNTTGGVQFYADCNPTTGTITTGTSGGTITASGVIPIAGGGYRFWVAGSTGGTGAQVNNPVVYYGTDVDVKHSKVQFEIGSSASSYIATTTIAVARNADVLTYSSSGNVDGTVGWCYAEITYPQTATNNSPRIIHTDAAGIGGIPLFLTSATRKIALYDGTAREGSALTLPVNSPVKVGSTWGGTTSTLALSGATTAAGFDGTMVVTEIEIGGDSSIPGNELNGTIRNVRIGQRALSSSELQTVTA